MRPTAMMMIRNDEVQRTRDYKTKKGMLLNIIKQHKMWLVKERREFKNEPKTKNPELKDLVLSLNNDNKSVKGRYNTEKEVKQTDKSDSKLDKRDEKVTLISILNKEYAGVNLLKSNFVYSGFNPEHKNYNINIPQFSNNSLWEQKFRSINSDYNVEVNFGKIIKKYFVEFDHNTELEFKKYSDDRDKEKTKDYVGFFFHRFDLVNEDKMKQIFNIFRQRDIVSENISQEGENEEPVITKEESTEVIKLIEIISKALLEITPFLNIKFYLYL